MRTNGTIGALLGILFLLGTGSVAEAAVNRLERPGTIGISGYGAFGWVTGNSRYGLDFGTGWGLGFTLRYVTSPHWAVGLNFQQQTYNPYSDVEYDKLAFTDILFNLYYYRERKSDASQYLVFGAGFYRPEVHFPEGTTSFPGENLVLQGGLGIELFIRETFALDLSGQAYGYFGNGYALQEPVTPGDGNFSVGLIGQVGFIFYVTK